MSPKVIQYEIYARVGDIFINDQPVVSLANRATAPQNHVDLTFMARLKVNVADDANRDDCEYVALGSVS